MLPISPRIKKFQSAKKRFLKPSIKQFFLQEFPKYFGPKIAENIADEMIKIFEQLNIDTSIIQPGQLFWNALDKNTRADSPKVRFIPVVLTMVNHADIERYVQGHSFNLIARDALARMINEAYQQGGILSMRDLSILTLRNDSWISKMRIQYERENQVVLPHTGSLHDMGTCITHKKQIISKVIAEKKDPAMVARETNHSQSAVDTYLVNYRRVTTVYLKNPDINHIHFVTKIAKHVIKQYIEIYDLYEKP